MTAKRQKVRTTAEDLRVLLAPKGVDKDIAEILECFVSDLLWLEWLEQGGQAVLDSLKGLPEWCGSENPLPSDNWDTEEVNMCQCFSCMVDVGCGNPILEYKHYRKF
jgi:hypothetical protein